MEAPPERPVSKRAAARARRAQAQAEGRCTATAKSTGKPCRKTPVEGRSTCRRHGGAGGRPILHGRYSEELPARISARVNASLNDPTLTDNVQMIAAMDGLVREQAARAADLDTPEFRKQACERLATVRELIVDGKDPIDALEPLGALLERGLSQVVAEHRLFQLFERVDVRIADLNRTKLAKSNAINSVDLVSVLQALLAAIQRLAPPELAKLIADELERICGDVELGAPARQSPAGRN